MIKLIISFLILLIISCKPVSKDNLFNKIENTKKIIENKNKKELQKIKGSENSADQNKKIFYLIGDPYFIEGVEYIPEENYLYSEVGLATYYDKELHNKKTVNNDYNKVTELLGRHKTLPIPSIVKITNLENGLYLTVKIVDRLDDNASIIQVSRKVAMLLRFYKNNIAKVKVEVLLDPSKQWKNVIMSINEIDFNNTVVSAPTGIVSISNIDENLQNIKTDNIAEQPIELGFEIIEKIDIFLHVAKFKNYDEIKSSMKDLDLNLKYTSESIDNYYKLIIGPIDNEIANKLVSTFISKGYKEAELIFK